MKTDPVCGMTLDERNNDIHTMFAGSKYYFCSEDCRREFEERPEEFVQVAA